MVLFGRLNEPERRKKREKVQRRTKGQVTDYLENERFLSCLFINSQPLRRRLMAEILLGFFVFFYHHKMKKKKRPISNF